MNRFVVFWHVTVHVFSVEIRERWLFGCMDHLVVLVHLFWKDCGMHISVSVCTVHGGCCSVLTGNWWVSRLPAGTGGCRMSGFFVCVV